MMAGDDPSLFPLAAHGHRRLPFQPIHSSNKPIPFHPWSVRWSLRRKPKKQKKTVEQMIPKERRAVQPLQGRSMSMMMHACLRAYVQWQRLCRADVLLGEPLAAVLGDVDLGVVLVCLAQLVDPAAVGGDPARLDDGQVGYRLLARLVGRQLDIGSFGVLVAVPLPGELVVLMLAPSSFDRKLVAMERAWVGSLLLRFRSAAGLPLRFQLRLWARRCVMRGCVRANEDQE
ncbi:hypothetical protein IWX50DRAFT_432792 [Phyllosticta citricarpa]